MQYTNEAQSDCEKKAIFAVDVLDEKRRLLVEKIPINETLDRCGFGKLKCNYLEKWINLENLSQGKAELPKDAIKPSTTISQVIDHVC